jgi:hypothetical protein
MDAAVETSLLQAPRILPEPYRNQLLHESLWQRTVDEEVECALGHRVALELVGELRQD